MFYKSNEFELIVEDLIRKTKFDPIKLKSPQKSGYAFNGNVKLFYEVFEPLEEIKASAILISRNSNTILFWPDRFIDGLISKNIRVIRFDHRGIGFSDWINNWKNKTAYALEDMVYDTMEVLKKLKINQAHIIGASMGGMIAQRFVLEFPKVALSLTSIMSSGYFYDPQLTAVSSSMKKRFSRILYKYKFGKKNLVNFIKMHLVFNQLWTGNGSYGLNLKEDIQLLNYEIKNRNGMHQNSFLQHTTAIKKSGSVLDRLKHINIPSLIIHGTDDALISIKHAHKYAAQIKNSKTLFISGMGHDLPQKYTPQILNHIINLIYGIKTSNN